LLDYFSIFFSYCRGLDGEYGPVILCHASGGVEDCTSFWYCGESALGVCSILVSSLALEGKGLDHLEVTRYSKEDKSQINPWNQKLQKGT
jgi:hypothetical protein